MLDAVARDQLRTFIAAADEGSFSAAGRKLRRAQSVISQTLRTRRASSASIGAAAGPVLTAQGQVLPAHARTVAGDVDRLKAHARSIAQGLEPELSIAVDVMFPMGKLNGCDGVSCRFSAHPPAGTRHDCPSLLCRLCRRRYRNVRPCCMTRYKKATKDLPFTVTVSEDIEVLAILHNGAGVEIPDSVCALYDTKRALHKVHLSVCEPL